MPTWRAACLSVLAFTALAGSAVAQPSPEIACSFPPSVKAITSFGQLPAAIRETFSEAAGKSRAVLQEAIIAEADAPFRVTDVIDDKALSPRRFIRGGQSGDHWFFWYEHGGFGYHLHVVAYDLPATVLKPVLVDNFQTGADTICAATRMMLDGGRPARHPQASEHF